MKRSALVFLLALFAQAGPAAAHSGDQVSIDRLTQIIAAYPEQQALYIKRGAIYSQAGSWQLADSDFQRAYLFGDPREVSFELGLMRFRQGDYGHAQAQFSLYLSMHPNAAEALLYRARAAQAAGAPQMALTDFQAYFTLVDQPHPGDLLAAAMLMAQGPDPAVVSALALIDGAMAKVGLQPQLQRNVISKKYVITPAVSKTLMYQITSPHKEHMLAILLYRKDRRKLCNCLPCLITLRRRLTLDIPMLKLLQLM